MIHRSLDQARSEFVQELRRWLGHDAERARFLGVLDDLIDWSQRQDWLVFNDSDYEQGVVSFNHAATANVLWAAYPRQREGAKLEVLPRAITRLPTSIATQARQEIATLTRKSLSPTSTLTVGFTALKNDANRMAVKTLMATLAEQLPPDEPYRGSRKHVLDWVESPTLEEDLASLLQPLSVSVAPDAAWMPRGHRAPAEARLESYGPRNLPDVCDWSALSSWWLDYVEGANTPNWDFVCPGLVEGRQGVILIEAKAHEGELSEAGKAHPRASGRSTANHERIGRAISEASGALARTYPGVNLRRDSHYQLANRISFAWKLASLGLPTVLVYLGFTGDRTVGRPFDGDADWRRALVHHARTVWPSELFDRRIDVGETPFWVLVRSRPMKGA